MDWSTNGRRTKLTERIQGNADMTIDEFLKLIEGIKSPALLLLCLIAWQSIRTISKGLNQLESMDNTLKQIRQELQPMVERVERMSAKLDDVHSDVAGLPLQLLSVGALRDRKS